MRIAVMQPYFFPYIGYFQLIAAVDKFVFYDDVNYINRGWINRNNILINGKATLITLPLKKASQNKKINDIEIAMGSTEEKLLKTISMSYKKAPYFENAFELIQRIFEKPSTTIADFNLNQIKIISKYLNIETELVPSSSVYDNRHLNGPERIIDICCKENADWYVNPIGGFDLYDRDSFNTRGIRLSFIKPTLVQYNQFNIPFVPWLSIIDILMFNGTKNIKQMLKQYQFV
ncbi:MAG: WbqC family protein [Cyclobacteriaceae bacterium]